MRHRSQVTTHIVFIAGLALMLLGIGFLLGTMTGVSRLSVLWSFLFVIIGAFCAGLAIKRNKRTVYLFFAAFLILIGIFLFLSTLKIIPITLAQGWPLISVFSGLALLPAGLRHYGGFRYKYLIPSLAFVILGCALLVFSFKIVSFSFKRFVVNWWPLLILLGGLILILLSISSRSGDRDEVP
ncbi:MAG: hypothetical protein LBO65_07740 [Spirochaetaceae bacterium]|jgi:hypothetical protein|nr:hypothetical protein [Spirochaetaceae bacterium]